MLRWRSAKLPQIINKQIISHPSTNLKWSGKWPILWTWCPWSQWKTSRLRPPSWVYFWKTERSRLKPLLFILKRINDLRVPNSLTGCTTLKISHARKTAWQPRLRCRPCQASRDWWPRPTAPPARNWRFACESGLGSRSLFGDSATRKGWWTPSALANFLETNFRLNSRTPTMTADKAHITLLFREMGRTCSTTSSSYRIMKT